MQNSKTVKMATLFVIICIIVLFLLAKFMFVPKFPENEWHSKHLCSKQKLSSLQSGLERYMRDHTIFLPSSFRELMEGNYISQSDLICPSQYKNFDQESLRTESFPFYMTCFELMTPERGFDDLSEGEVIVKEFAGNHLLGYHVIRKRGDLLTREFIDDNISED